MGGIPGAAIFSATFPVMVADHRSTLARTRPVVAILANRRGTVGERTGQDVVAVRVVSATVDGLTVLVKHALFRQPVVLVQIDDAAR